MFLRMTHVCVCAAKHPRLSSHRTDGATNTAVFVLVVIRTRSIASGARDGGRGRATVLCVRTEVFCKEGLARCMQRIMQPIAVAIPPFHKLEYSYSNHEGDHKYQNTGLCS